MISAPVHRDAMSRYYSWHSRIYDATRWSFLFDRDAILRDLDLQPGQTIVEIGCGTGRNVEAIARHVGPSGKVVAVDCAASMLERCRKRIHRQKLTNVRIVDTEYGQAPIAGQQADVVLMSYSLSMIPEWAAVLRCACEELKSGGRIGVVDFCLDSDTAAPRAFARWMALNHVALERPYKETLSLLFRPLQCVTRKAFGGLWSYYRFVGERSGPHTGR